MGDGERVNMHGCGEIAHNAQLLTNQIEGTCRISGES